MRRSLALAVIAASALRAAPARAEPLDIDLGRLGPATDPAARGRFAVLATQLGLALDSSILAPANTVGHSGFEFAFETAYAPAGLASLAGNSPFGGKPPSAFVLPAFHVRKALPYSIEVGGRAIYLNQSTQFATQAEVKWAVNEGLEYVPDVAVRVSATRFFGVRDLNLGVYGLDGMIGKRLGVGGVMSLTPYGAVRFSWVWAGSDWIQYGDPSNPATVNGTAAYFPELSGAQHRFTRFALGLRMIAASVTLSLEGTYTLGRTFTATADYPAFQVPAAFSGSASFGFTF